MPNSIRLLLLEDRPSDAELMIHELRRADFEPEWRRVETEAEYLAALDPSLDLILADYSLPQFDGLRALDLLQRRGLDVPLIVVSGSIGEDIAVEVMKLGAADYLLKGKLARLGRAVALAVQGKRLREETRRTEAALRQSEAKFRNLIEHLPGIAYIADPGEAGVWHYVSPQIESILGFSPDEWLATPGLWARQLHPDDREQVQADEKRSLTGDPTGTFNFEYRLLARDGQVVWVRDSAVLLRDEAKGALYWQGVLYNITLRKQAEEALRQSELRYRAVTELMSDYAYALRLDPDGSAIREWVTGSYARITGFTPAEVDLPDSWKQVIFPDDLDIATAHFDRICSGQPSECEYRIRSKSGEVHWLRDAARPVQDPAGDGALRVFGTAKDITERRRAEAARRASEERYRTLIEQASDGIFLVDSTARVIEVNPSGCAMLGFSRDELLDMRIADLIPTEDWETAPPKLEELRTGQVVVSQRRLRRKDGTLLPVEISAKFLPGGRTQGIVRDITEQKRAQEEIRRRAEQFAALYEISNELATQRDLPTLLVGIVEWAMALLGASSGGVYLHEAERDELELVVVRGVLEPYRGSRVPLGEGLCGSVAQSRRPNILDDYQSWAGRSGKYEGQPIRAALGVPMLYGGELIGVLVVNETGGSRRRYTEADSRVLSLFASSAAGAVQGARLFEETSLRLRQLESVNRVSTTMRAAQTLDEMLPRLLDETLGLMDTDSGALWLYEPAQDQIQLAVARGWFKDLNEAPMRPGEGSPGLSRRRVRRHSRASSSATRVCARPPSGSSRRGGGARASRSGRPIRSSARCSCRSRCPAN